MILHILLCDCTYYCDTRDQDNNKKHYLLRCAYSVKLTYYCDTSHSDNNKNNNFLRRSCDNNRNEILRYCTYFCDTAQTTVILHTRTTRRRRISDAADTVVNFHTLTPPAISLSKKAIGKFDSPSGPTSPVRRPKLSNKPASGDNPYEHES